MSLLKLPMLTLLAEALESGMSSLQWIDLYSAQYAAESDPEQAESIAFLSLLTSQALAKGHTHVSIASLPDAKIAGLRELGLTLEAWRERLIASPAVLKLDQEDQIATPPSGNQFELAFEPVQEVENTPPFVWYEDRIYTRRYWLLDRQVNEWFEAGKADVVEMSSAQWLEMGDALRQVYSTATEHDELDWQAVASAQALTQNLCLITGGPGTGKTTTAANILRLLIKQFELLHERSPRIRLLAPTGKAAVRLHQSIHGRLNETRGQFELPEGGETIHRFIYQTRQAQRHTSDDALLLPKTRMVANVDIVLIDESTMIDLSLMAQLLNLLPAHARVVMLGDHHQLPAIEPGQVFSDWVKHYQALPYADAQTERLEALLGIKDMLPSEGNAFNPVCSLKKTYRFGGELKQIADLMKSGQANELVASLKALAEHTDKTEGVRWIDDFQGFDYASVCQPYEAYFSLAKDGASLRALADAFVQYQVLCSTHEGPLGSKRFNQQIEASFVSSESVYHGKAIMLTENHAHLGVYNGDVGFYIKKESGDFIVVFSNSDAELIELAPASLKAWQPAYAMSIHKSQGSEFDRVCMVIADYAQELLSREMLYTGLTRGKTCVDLRASEGAIHSALDS